MMLHLLFEIPRHICGGDLLRGVSSVVIDLSLVDGNNASFNNNNNVLSSLWCGF